MKILYAVQATGNGHISRAMELLPYLQNYGTIDVFLSGSNSNLTLNANVAYRSKGLSLFYSGNGGLNYRKIATDVAPLRILKEVKQLPVEKYDLVINDFECITPLACAYKKVKSVQFGHQASFMSAATPRPSQKNIMGEWVLKNYARAQKYIGLHFESYDDFILPPVIKKEIWGAYPTNQQYITVYLLSYADAVLYQHFLQLKDCSFQIFSKEATQTTSKGNCTFIPVDKKAFNKSLINCYGIITGAGFETPAEALHLNKKILAIPVKGQYEQACNAAALQRFGVKVIKGIDQHFTTVFNDWVYNNQQQTVVFKKDTQSIVSSMMQIATYNENLPMFGVENLAW